MVRLSSLNRSLVAKLVGTGNAMMTVYYKDLNKASPVTKFLSTLVKRMLGIDLRNVSGTKHLNPSRNDDQMT